MKKLIVLGTLTFVISLPLLIGCNDDTTTGPDNEGQSDHSIGWAINIANGVRDNQFGEAELIGVICADIQDNGEPEVNMPWQVFFAEVPSPDGRVLEVIVMYDGSTTVFWENDSSLPVTPMPEYDDAGPWVTTARNGIGAEYANATALSLLVGPNEYEEYPDVANMVIINFYDDSTGTQIIALVDADDNEFVHFETSSPTL